MADTGRLAGRRILVVSAEGAWRTLVRDALELERATVLEAGSVDAALDGLRAARIDAVVSDLQIAATGPVPLYERACADDPRLVHRFVFLTGDPGSAPAAEMRSHALVLGKPLSLDHLIAAVQSVASRRW